MHSTHSTFVPDLDLNPPASWSKPASALGLSNPLSHLPQSQQMQKLQEQIQHHRQLQRSAQSSGKSKRSQNTKSASNGATTNSSESSNNRPIANVQHINITNNDDDSNMSEDDRHSDNEAMAGHRTSASAMDIKRTNQNHNRSMSQPQLTHGFNIQGFNSFNQGSLSPSSPGSLMLENDNSFTASMLTPGLLTQGHSGNMGFTGEAYGNNNDGNMSIGGVESSLATLSVISSSLSSMPGGGPLRRSASGYSSSSSSFQPQSLPVIYQNQVTGTVGGATHSSMFNAFSRQNQQQSPYQQPASVPTLSTSLPAHSNFQQYHQQSQESYQQQQQQQQQQFHPPPPSSINSKNEDEDSRRRSRSKSLTVVPPPRTIPPRPPQTSAPRKYHGRQARKVPITNVVKEVVTPTRRMAHILSEQKRREKINGGFDELKSVIPECAQNTDSKATILRKAVDYILLLEDELRKYMDHDGEEGSEDLERQD
ncbi:hypothetical protein BGZ74_007603 [Mortierella antarctica]|nr:hypothetical protein BGZ74_007603 [Mortierella antarctica]